MFMACHPFFRQEVAPQEQRLALHLQQARGRGPRLQILRLIFGSDVEAGSVPRFMSEKTVFSASSP